VERKRKREDDRENQNFNERSESSRFCSIHERRTALDKGLEEKGRGIGTGKGPFNQKRFSGKRIAEKAGTLKH